jgi:molybdenum cofactor guanylyltransferase
MPSSETQRGEELVIGILVGGASRRMGGQPKGLLPAPGGQERIVPRLLRLAEETLPGAVQVLVGTHDAYAELGVPMLGDALPGAGPVAGLVSLLRHASVVGRREALLLACDLPHLTAELLLGLARYEFAGLALAPRIDGRFQPLFARYGVEALSLAEQALLGPDRSFQALLRSLNASVFPLTPAEERALVDWDEPGDLSE